jgi:hypothetical protein
LIGPRERSPRAFCLPGFGFAASIAQVARGYRPGNLWLQWQTIDIVLYLFQHIEMLSLRELKR